MPRKPVRPNQDAGDGRADATRERLLTAALDLFGRHGFDSVTTRMLAEAANVNLQAINYHFGTKRGLYIATADHLVAMIDRFIGPLREMVRQRVAEIDASGQQLGVEEARRMLMMFVSSLLTAFMAEGSETWARFMVREQADPTEAFERVYGGIMRPGLAVVRRLVGVVTGEAADSDWVRLRTLTLVGSVIIFRVDRATLLRELGWPAIGPNEADAVRALATDLVASIRPREGAPS